MTMKTPITKLLATNFAAIHEDNCHGFYDWFCKDTSLPNKAKRLCAKLKTIANSKKFNPDETYVFFKNNCLVVGLYDDFRICSIETGKVLYTVVPQCAGSKLAEVWGTENKFEGPLVRLVEGTWDDVKNFFNPPETKKVN